MREKSSSKNRHFRKSTYLMLINDKYDFSTTSDSHPEQSTTARGSSSFPAIHSIHDLAMSSIFSSLPCALLFAAGLLYITPESVQLRNIPRFFLFQSNTFHETSFLPW